MESSQEIVTPSGHKVFINPTVTYGIRRQLQKVFLSSGKVDSDKMQADFNMAAVYDAQDLAVKLLVVKIVESSGKEIIGGEECFKAISSWANQEDGDTVYQKINEFTQMTPDSKKKLS